jgi:hypothetical protein
LYPSILKGTSTDTGRRSGLQNHVSSANGFGNQHICASILDLKVFRESEVQVYMPPSAPGTTQQELGRHGRILESLGHHLHIYRNCENFQSRYSNPKAKLMAMLGLHFFEPQSQASKRHEE